MKSGTTLAGRYIIRESGRRTLCGDYYLAQDVGSGLLVSIQTIPELIGGHARWLADLRRNFLLLHTLDHPHITKLHALEYDSDQRIHFLVQEHAFGVSLQEYRLSRPGQKVPIGEAIAICRQLADALDHAHRSLLHRALCPDSVLLTPEGYVKLWNFDLFPNDARERLRQSAAWDCDQPKARSTCYRAPEQFAGPLSTSPATDLWALAVLFHEMTSGSLPFATPDPQALEQVVCTQPPTPVKKLGRRRNRVLARALSKNPSQRFPSAIAFVEALESVWLPRSVVEMRKMTTLTLGTLLLLTLIFWGLLLRVMSTPREVAQIPTSSEQIALTPDLKKSLLLQIESRPTAATVVLDGKRLGATPFTVGRVAPGAYHLWLEKPGFKPVDVEIDLTQDTIVSMNLAPLSPAEPETVEQKGATAPVGPPTGQEKPSATPTREGGEVPVNMPLEVQTVQPIPEPPPLTKADLPAMAEQAVAPEGVPAPAVVPVVRDASTGTVPPREEVTVQQEVSAHVVTEAALRADAAPAEPVRDDPVRTLLLEAAKDIQAARLTLPKGKNAAEKYQAILKKDPRHPEAREGMARIASQLLVLANEATKAGYLTQPPGRNACEKFQAVLTVYPGHPEIGKGVERLVVRYLDLAKSDQPPKPIVDLLDRALAVLPDDPGVAAARRLLSLPGPATEEKSSRNGTPPGPSVTPTTTIVEQGVISPAGQAPAAPVLLVAGSVTTLSHPEEEIKKWRDGVTGLEFVWIEKGCFQMGSAQGDGDEVPVHPVCLNGFWMGRHEVTQAAWYQVMAPEANPALFQKGGDYPLDSVSWEMAQQFVHRLNIRSTYRFRLPTEAEWEYSCRAGSQTPFHFGNSIHAGKANFNGERDFGRGSKGHYVGSTLPVGSFPANRFGLFDMHGNVYEWVADGYDKTFYNTSPRENPVATGGGSLLAGSHVLRGGAWYSTPHHLRCAARYWGDATQRDHGYGFRLLREETS